jgi:small conductance mechanosensitive channel
MPKRDRRRSDHDRRPVSGPRRAAAPRHQRRPSARALHRSAASRLRRFRSVSVLVVGLTALLLLLWDVPTAGQDVADTATVAATTGADTLGFGEAAGRAVGEARTTLRSLAVGFYGFLPKLAVAVVVLVLAWLLSKLLAAGMRRATASWVRGEGAVALTRVVVWILALGAALSIIVGDARALVGSVGLTGLALSWALQTPIESFTGWVLNSFRGYYRIGDRIGVGDVFGDVYSIDVLTTTVWEAGGPGKAVQGAQPTGALITFPNNEILRANVVNYTGDFPFVWDEITVGITNESDLSLALTVTQQTADRLLGERMREPVRQYQRLLESRGLPHEMADGPQVYLSADDSWVNVTVRYLVDARRRRRTASDLLHALVQDFGSPEYQGKLGTAHPRMELLMRDRD